MNKKVYFKREKIFQLELLKKFNHIVVGSEYMKKHLLMHGFDNDRLSKIRLFSQPVKKGPLNNPSQNKKNFLFVGELSIGKGVDTLLDAFSKLESEDRYLDICGDGKEREEFEERAKNLGISDKVSFHGKLDTEKLENFYADAYAVVIPSRTPETFSLVGLEAMKFAKAVIASDVGGIREWLNENENGITTPSNDPKELAIAMQFAIDNPQRIKEMGDDGLKSYEQNFKPDQHCKDIHKLFRSMTLKESYAV